MHFLFIFLGISLYIDHLINFKCIRLASYLIYFLYYFSSIYIILEKYQLKYKVGSIKKIIKHVRTHASMGYVTYVLSFKRKKTFSLMQRKCT
jgi:hypothetical protein